MKHSAARFAAIWWPPVTFVPSPAASSVMNVNDVISTMYDSPVGTPSRSNSRCSTQRGHAKRKPNTR